MRAAIRILAICVIVTLATTATALLWWLLPWCVVIILLAALGPCALAGFRNRAATKQLASLGPKGLYVYVHGVARVPGCQHKGEAALVLARLAEEADQRGWLLALDAGASRLVDYYRQFGFEPMGQPVHTTWGTAVRMVRRPLAGYA